MGLQIGALLAFSIITETVFQWPGMGLLIIQAVQFVDIPVMSSLPGADRAVLRADQPRRRPALLRRRPAPAGRAPGRGVLSDAARSADDRPPSLGSRARVGDDLQRFLDGDLCHSFMRSPVTIVAAIVTLLLFLAALFAPWLAPHDTYDLASLNLLDAFRPPAWADGGDPSFLLGTDDQGRDVLSAIMFGLRISLLVGFAVGRAGSAGRHRARAAQRLCRRHARQRRSCASPTSS